MQVGFATSGKSLLMGNQTLGTKVDSVSSLVKTTQKQDREHINCVGTFLVILQSV